MKVHGAAFALLGTASALLFLGVLWSSYEAVAKGHSGHDQDDNARTSRYLANIAGYSDPKSVEAANREVNIDSLVLPNVLMIGAMKASTTSVSDLLYSNGVCDADIFPGEPGFYHKEGKR